MISKRENNRLHILYGTILSLLLRGFYRLLYHGASWSYDAVAWFVSAGHWPEWVGQARDFVRGKQVLELGFGPGHLSMNLAEAGFYVVGIDLSRQMCQRLQKKISDLREKNPYNGYAEYPDIVLASGIEVPLHSGSMDTVIATFPTEYVFLEKTASECYRVLRDGGRLVLLLSVHITGRTVAEKASGLLFQLTGQEGTLKADWLGPFREAGFCIEFRLVELGHSQVTIVLGEKPGID